MATWDRDNPDGRALLAPTPSGAGEAVLEVTGRGGIRGE